MISPAAKIFSLPETCIVSRLTSIYPFVVGIATSSNPIFSVKGLLPIATKTVSKVPFSLSEKLTSFPLTESIDVPILKVTPRFVNCFLNSPEVLLSRPGRISFSSSTTVTVDPRSISRLANSQPMAPAPTTHTFAGGFSQLRAVSELIMNLLSYFKLGNSLGLEPVANNM